MNLLLAFFAFNFIIIVHEMGHFLTARKAGIKVLEFSLFVGPKIFQINRGGTLYTLRMFPILAYVKMEGEEEHSEKEDAFNKKSVATRAAVVAAGPLANLVMAIIVLTLVFSITGYATTKIDYIEEDSPAAAAGLMEGDRLISYSGKRVFQLMDIAQFLHVYKGDAREIRYKRGNETLKTVIKPEIIPPFERYLMGFGVLAQEGKLTNIVDYVAQDTPAMKAGLKSGDVIILLNGREIEKKEDIDGIMADNTGEEIQLTVLRAGEKVNLKMIPYLQKTEEQYILGFSFSMERGGFFKTTGHAVTYAYSTVRNVALGLGWLISGKVSINQLTGPVGIVSSIGEVVGQASGFKDKILYLLNITAFLSIAIGATNLIPFPALDGNKLLLLLVEGIRKKPLPPEKEALISTIGFVILISLAIFTIYNDFLRIFTG